MDEQRTDLRAALRELAAEESGGLGPHVGLKRLTAYRQGTLPAAERESVQEHLSLCPRCTRLLLELRNFESAAAGGDTGPESQRQEAWDSLARRLPAKTPTVRPISTAVRRETPRLRSFPPLLVGLAAALLLAVLGLALWAALTAQQSRQQVLRLERQLEERDVALAALRDSLTEAERQLGAERGQPAGRVDELEARVAELTAALEELRRTTRTPQARDRIAVTSEGIQVSVSPRFVLRGQERSANGFLHGGGAVNPLRLRTPTDRVTVTLSLAEHPVYDEYRLELVDRDGKVLWTGQRPGSSLLGDAGTSVAMSGLGPGRYRLRIEGLKSGRGERLAEYLLEIELQETR